MLGLNDNLSQRQLDEKTSENANPFKYLYKLRYQNPSVLNTQKIQMEPLPTIINQNNDDFFQKKFDQYLVKAADPKFHKT